MLVLCRKTGEKIQIGPDITVTVLEVRTGRIRVGISAPREMSIRRGELMERPAPGSHEKLPQASDSQVSGVTNDQVFFQEVEIDVGGSGQAYA